MDRTAEVERITKETNIQITLKFEGQGLTKINSGIPFFDHMLTLLAVHGFFDLSVQPDWYDFSILRPTNKRLILNSRQETLPIRLSDCFGPALMLVSRCKVPRRRHDRALPDSGSETLDCERRTPRKC